MPAGEIPRTPSAPGDAPERFKDATEVISLASQMFGADQKRAVWRSTVERLWAGEPVYPLAKLQQMGQAWRARTNYRGLEGIITTQNTLDYDLETQGEQIVCIYLDIGQGQEKEDWERIMADEFKWMLHKRWKGYNYHTQKRIFQRNLHGMGVHFWPDADGNWIPRTPSAGEVLFPDDCPFNFDEDGDFFMTRDPIPSYILYNKIKNEKEARALGWNTEIAWKALTLIDKTTGRNTRGYASPDWAARQYAQGDIGYWTTRQSTLYINSVYVREYETGKVSQYSVVEGLDLKDYIYKKRDKFDRWPLRTFPYDNGNGNIHSVKGLGGRTKDYFEMMNRLYNAGVDQVMISSYPNMKQTVQNLDPDKAKLARMGGVTWLPYGAEPALVQFPDMRQGLLALEGTLNQQMERNNKGVGVTNVEQKDRMTEGEYIARMQDGNGLSNASMAMQKSYLDDYYDRIVRLCASAGGSKKEYAVIAREWRERCIARGVPPQAFQHIAEVGAVLAYGKGSASARTSAYREMFQSPVYAQGSQQNQIAIERGYVGSLLGQSAVEQYCRSADSEEVVDAGESFAVQENNAMRAGNEALAASTQDQVKHLQVHFADVAELVAAYDEGQIDPQQAYVAVVAFGRHTKQHLDFLRGNQFKAKDFQFFFNQWQQLSRIADKLRADIESASESEPPEQQLSDKLQIGLANAQIQGQVQTLKAQNSAQLKQRQQAHREWMDQQKLAGNEQRSNAKLLNDVQRSNVEAATTIAQDAALTQADIDNKQRKGAATA